MSDVVLKAQGLHKSYRRGAEEIHALQGVDLELHPGEVTALVGPSGSGKTTLLNVLAGWETSDSGTLTWRGDDYTGRAASIPWTQMSIVPQSLGLIAEMSVRENVEAVARFGNGTHDGGRVDGLLDVMGLTKFAHRLPGETSLGEQQRVALARALVSRPALVIADEPTSHQDVGWTRAVLEILRSAAAEGTSCLLATHHRATVTLADRALQIRDGVVAEAEPESLVLQGDEL